MREGRSCSSELGLCGVGAKALMLFVQEAVLALRALSVGMERYKGALAD